MLELLGPVVGVAAAAGYLGAVQVSGREWPRRRTVSWLAGLLLAVIATVGPLAEAAHQLFAAHVVAHLVIAMAGPLLLVLAAPVTLALRSLPVGGARRLSRVLRSRVIRVLSEPGVAAAIDMGGLWGFYRTGIWTATHHHQAVHLATHTHMFLAGTLFTVAVVGVDPIAHRRSFGHRAVVVVLAAAAHGILAKTLYVQPPAGVSETAAQTGAVIMYYGGDLVELALLIVLCAAWYRSRRRLSYRATTRSAVRTPEPRPGRSAP